MIAGIEIELSRGWSSFVAAHLEVKSRIHPSIDRIPGFTLTRIFQALANPEEREALAFEVARRGDDPSLGARQAVALFFVLNVDAKGLEIVLDAWRDDPSRYDDHPAAFGPDRMLKSNLLEAIACRLRRDPGGSAGLLAVWRWAALHGTGLGIHLHRAPLIDGTWTKGHVEQLLDVAPADWRRIIGSIHVESPIRLIPGCQRAIAEGYATREDVTAALTEQHGAQALPAITAL